MSPSICAASGERVTERVIGLGDGLRLATRDGLCTSHEGYSTVTVRHLVVQLKDQNKREDIVRCFNDFQ